MMGIRRKASISMMVLLGCAWTVLLFSDIVSGQTVRTVRGEVVAINVNDSPNVIVVKTMTAKKQELIVGATVESGAEITRGPNRVSLNDIKVGETVDLTYIKNEDGLVARSVHAR
ncbi:MAG: hypothetical protein HY581_03265 [Nitrospirae bacterium]|nr:hypothetical protein [Nitrospirota bacterium]